MTEFENRSLNATGSIRTHFIQLEGELTTALTTILGLIQ